MTFEHVLAEASKRSGHAPEYTEAMLDFLAEIYLIGVEKGAEMGKEAFKHAIDEAVGVCRAEKN